MHVDTTVTSTVDDAIVRVLQAEQAAREAVTRCAADAERIRQEARVRAHAIAERAAERANRVHRWADDAIRTRIAALNEQRTALQQPSAADPGERMRLAHALDRLACELGSESDAG
jgi:cell division septum initiation protein DivIVA